MILLVVFCIFARKQNKQLKNAGIKMQRFMEGDTSIRLEDNQEDSLSCFFAIVNTMATSLNAHIEKEKHSREFLKDTISDISHQLKTPLAALQMYNEIISEEETTNQVVGDFTLKSQREISRMEGLIQNLLKLAKLDVRAIELEKKSHNLNEFLRKCLATFITRAKIEGKHMSLQCDDSVTLNFDETWLLEAVGNLIKNALDHTNQNDEIEISCTETVIATEITIKDSGSGIHPEDIHHIFKRFYRSRYSKDRQGVGIGLALAKAIVEQHGGTITVKSEYGSNTEIHLIFPKLSNL
jgi:signal transduction histidine kinase